MDDVIARSGYAGAVRHRLLPHPDCPPAAVEAVAVEIDVARRTWSLDFAVAGADALVVPDPADPARTDSLWRTTCFELFVQPERGGGYFEFNLSPSTQWAAYRFESYRAGMHDWAMPAPRIERRRAGLQATLDLSGLPGGAWRVGLCAVIEESGARKSYWALAHAAGKPDFHHPDCFALELPAASAA